LARAAPVATILPLWHEKGLDARWQASNKTRLRRRPSAAPGTTGGTGMPTAQFMRTAIALAVLSLGGVRVSAA